MGNAQKVLKTFCESLCPKKTEDSNGIREKFDINVNKLKREDFLKKSYISNRSIMTVDDFKIMKTLGKGSFAKVLLAKNLKNEKYYAMKVLRKEFLEKNQQIDNTKTEREILEKIDHPFIVKLRYAFQSNEKLYLVCDYMQGGEMYYHLRKDGNFSEERTRFYICEIILALEHLHKCGIIYRDLKPENILLDKEGHIKLTDFGLSKIILDKHSDRAYTICGTPEYLAPEILLGKGYNKSVDWWSLGAVMHEMICGYSPYKENKYKLDMKVYLKPIIKTKAMSENCYQLIKELLNPDSSRRLGASIRDSEEIKKHPFFKGVDWTNVLEKRVIPSYVPMIKNEEDFSNFDRMFTSEDPTSSLTNLFPNKNMDNDFDNNYNNFSYIGVE